MYDKLRHVRHMYWAAFVIWTLHGSQRHARVGEGGSGNARTCSGRLEHVKIGGGRLVQDMHCHGNTNKEWLGQMRTGPDIH